MAKTIPPSKAIELLIRQVDAGKRLLAQHIVDENSFDAWDSTVENYLIKSFGSDSPNLIGFQQIGYLGMASSSWDDQWWENHRRETLQAKLSRLGAYIDVLKTETELRKPISRKSIRKSTAASPSRKVFLVHGHSDAVRETCARLLEKLKLEPIILHEKPNAGRTIIEKFQDYSDVRFAIVLLTADDKGAAKKDFSVKQLKFRARQNVIFEFGFFIGKLGRSKVCALYEDDVEIPSDYNGVVFIPLDSGNGWRYKLARELKESGFAIDLNRIK